MPNQTDERDKELDSLQEELRTEGAPYIHQPDEVKSGDGTACFLNHERICGPDCISFNWELPFDRRQGANQCVILYHLGAMSSGAIAYVHSTNLIKKAEARERQRREDEAREAASKQEPPKV